MGIAENALEKAKEVLRGNITDAGLIAGRQYYRDIWARDGFITCLGMCVSGEEDLMYASKLTIDSIAEFQKENGQIPNKISPDKKKVCFGEGGCVDSSLWYPIAVWNYYKSTGDFEFLEKHVRKSEKAVKWASSLDQNGDFLIETNEGADWMDLLLRSGRVLYDEVLYYVALRLIGKMKIEVGEEEDYSKLAEKVKESINLFFWPNPEKLSYVKDLYGYTGIEQDFKTALTVGKRDYYLAEVRFRYVDSRCDVYANCLAILFGLADKEKANSIFSYFDREKLYEPYPIKALWPPIKREDPDWILHFRWTDIPRLAEPGSYHNGGIWPYIGGFYALSLIKEGRSVESVIEKLAEANLKSEFNEWLDQRGEGAGSKYQSWSAGMFILAYESFKAGKLLIEI